MKKVLALFLLGLFVAFATSFTTQAAEGDLVDLYPYNQIACLEATSACTQTKLGDSFWDMEYAGHRYHFVRGAARFVSQFNDANSDGLISAGELGGALAWNAFASLTINNTAEEVVLSTANARTDLTSVVHRMYSYFDATGKLQKFEDHISTYYIFNTGTVAAPDWRLATAEEKAAWDAAATDAKPVTTRNTHIRMMLDATDSDGYKIEPLAYLTWRYADVAADAPIEDRSMLVTGNPDYVTIPAGWTVVSWGTLDRGTANPATTAYIKSMPTLMLNTTLAPMKTIYTTQKPLFNNALGAQDDDATTPGINIVVDYNGTFELPTGIEATYVDMFDNDNKIINVTRKINYQVIISQGETVLQTIDYTYNTETSSYTASGAATVIDSSVFGSGYTATYKAVNPENTASFTEVLVDIVIGVMPPKFIGVANRYIDEGTFIDLLGTVKADDGYGNDITDTIEITAPAGFNVYYPTPGVYTIDLEFSHHVHFDGLQSTLNFNGTMKNWNEQTGLNKSHDVNGYANYSVWTDVTNFRTSTSAYASAFAVIGADGKVDEVYDRYDWGYTSATETDVIKDAVHFAAWQAAVVIEEGGFIVAAAGSTLAPVIRNLTYDAPVALVIGFPEFNYDIVKTASYTLTVDDVTAPMALIVNDNYQIVEGQYANVNQAILANIVAFDNFDAIDDLAIYVSNNGGLNVNTPGSYDVEVTVEDAAGNATVVTFEVTVLNDDKVDDIADLLAQLEDAEQALADLEDQFGDDEAALAAAIARIAALEAALEAAEEAIEALQVVPETGCGSAINGSSALFITLSILMGAALIVFLKKRS